MRLLKLSEKNQYKSIQIHYENDVKMGELIINDDGYYVFFPENRTGYWPDFILKDLSEIMIELNKPWEEEINKYFEATISKTEGPSLPAIDERLDLADISITN